MEKKVVLGCESSSVPLKEAVKARLLSLGYQVEDVGQQQNGESVPYYEAARRVAEAIQSGEFRRGIVFCGTGAGVCMIANKFRGVYCVACESVFTAEKISLINNANLLAMGERVVSHDMGCEMAERFLAGEWCRGFEPRRRANNEKGYAVLRELEERFYR